MKPGIVIFFIFIFLQILNSCINSNEKLKKSNLEDSNNLSANNPNRSVIIRTSISDPINLEYEFVKIAKLEDGSSANAYIEKGKKDFKDGDYVWSKMIPFYASAEVKFAFEYQMNFTLTDLEALGKWLEETIGENVKVKSIDNPSWYKEDMTLGNIFNYCMTNNKNITMGYYSYPLERMALVIFDAGSTITNTSSEIAIVYFIYNSFPASK